MNQVSIDLVHYWSRNANFVFAVSLMDFFFLQFLFEKTSETIAVSSSSMKELIELRHLYDEAVKSNSQLEQELNDIKIENTEALNRAAQDYEERVLLLLSKLSNKVGTYLSL